MYIKLYEREERDLGIFHYCMKRDNKEQFANYLLGNPEMIKADPFPSIATNKKVIAPGNIQ